MQRAEKVLLDPATLTVYPLTVDNQVLRNEASV